MDDDNQVVVPETPEVVATTEDKAEVQTNEADVQVTSEAPEAAQDTGETSPELTAEDKVEDNPYLGKFKTPEDMAKAYAQLESKATRDAQEKAELARILNESFTAPEATSVVEDKVSYDEYETPDPVAQKIAALEVKDTIRDFTMLHPDANGQAIIEIANSDPIAKSMNSVQAKLEYAYLKSQLAAGPQAVAEAEKRASEQTQVKIAEKQAAQVEGAKQQSQPAGNENLSPSELRSTLRDDKAFDELIKQRFPGVSKMRTRT